jgi:hypothetical protein
MSAEVLIMHGARSSGENVSFSGIAEETAALPLIEEAYQATHGLIDTATLEPIELVWKIHSLSRP